MLKPLSLILPVCSLYHPRNEEIPTPGTSGPSPLPSPQFMRCQLYTYTLTYHPGGEEIPTPGTSDPSPLPSPQFLRCQLYPYTQTYHPGCEEIPTPGTSGLYPLPSTLSTVPEMPALYLHPNLPSRR